KFNHINPTGKLQIKINNRPGGNSDGDLFLAKKHFPDPSFFIPSCPSVLDTLFLSFYQQPLPLPLSHPIPSPCSLPCPPLRAAPEAAQASAVMPDVYLPNVQLLLLPFPFPPVPSLSPSFRFQG